MYRLGVVAPSWPFTNNLEAVESKLFENDIVLNTHLYKSQKIDLEEAFLNDGVDAIIAGRGGFGCCKLTGLLDWALIKNNIKPFLGYSDITILLNRLNKECGLVTFHAPVLKELTSLTKSDFNALIEVIKGGSLSNIYANSSKSKQICGVIAGGNLTVIASVIGTDDEVDMNDKILFIEDVGEELYRLDRCLWQLKNSGNLEKVKAIVLGEFIFGKVYNDEYQKDVCKLVKDAAPNKLVINRMESGHGERNAIFPIGQKINLHY